MLSFAVLLSVLAAACAPNTSTPSPIVTEDPTQAGAAVVKSIDILLLESFPLQVNAVLRGDLPDAGCTTIASVDQIQKGKTFHLTLVTTTDPLAICAQVLTPFEEVVSLDVYGLPAGTYTVEADDIRSTFEFTVDNILPTEPHQNQPTPPATAQTTDVEYVMAQQDVPIYGGHETQYGIVGSIAAGQTAKVTGVSSDQTWWRVVCPDGTIGDCWVSADPAWTQPAEPPQ
jgi:inhibitor of cysteine peptidase